MAKTGLEDVAEYLRPFAKYRRGLELDPESVAAMKSNSFPSVTYLAEAFVQTWNMTPYLSREGESRGSILGRLESSGVLPAVIAEETIDEIRCFLQVFEIEQQHRLVKSVNRSTRDHHIQFHRSMLIKLFRHLNEIRVLTTTHNVANNWLQPYLDSMHKQMMLEIRCISPLFPYRGIDYRPTTVDDSMDSAVCCVFGSVNEALKRGKYGKARKELALQLTRSICSPSNFFHISGTPTLDAIRKRVERCSKLRTKAPR